MINLQILDDHKLVIESLRKLINESGVAKVTNTYYDLKSCREGLAKELPDVFLLDIGLPDGDGVDFCAEITQKYPGLKIIMLTTYKEFSIARRALHNGALGYILKNVESDELLTGIETVNRGEEFLCEEIDVLLEEKKHEDTLWLSNREKEILKYIADGYTTNEIAETIFRSTENVRTFRKNLLIKLNARNMAELIKRGYEMKLIG